MEKSIRVSRNGKIGWQDVIIAGPIYVVGQGCLLQHHYERTISIKDLQRGGSKVPGSNVIIEIKVKDLFKNRNGSFSNILERIL